MAMINAKTMEYFATEMIMDMTKLLKMTRDELQEDLNESRMIAKNEGDHWREEQVKEAIRLLLK